MRTKKDGTPYQKPKKLFFGQVKNVEIGKALFNFAMSKDRYDKKGEIEAKGGVTFKQRCKGRKHAKFVSFEQLAEAGAMEVNMSGEDWLFLLTKQGLQVKRKGEKNRRVIPFAELFNSSRRQPLLFAEI